MPSRVRLADLDAFCQTGPAPAPARSRGACCDRAPEALVTTDTWGVFTHGTKLLPGYVRRPAGRGAFKGTSSLASSPRGPPGRSSMGGSLLGQVIGVRAMADEAIARARRSRHRLRRRPATATTSARRPALTWRGRARAGLDRDRDGERLSRKRRRPWPSAGRSPGRIRSPTRSSTGTADPILLGHRHEHRRRRQASTPRTPLGRPIPAPTGSLRPPGPTDDRREPLSPPRGPGMPMTGHKGYGLALLIEGLPAAATAAAAITTGVGGWMFGDPRSRRRRTMRRGVPGPGRGDDGRRRGGLPRGSRPGLGRREDLHRGADGRAGRRTPARCPAEPRVGQPSAGRGTRGSRCRTT